MDLLLIFLGVIIGILSIFLLCIVIADYGNNKMKDKVACLALYISTAILIGSAYFIYRIEPVITNKHVINTEYKEGSMVINFSEPTAIDVQTIHYEWSALHQDKVTMKTDSFILEK
jgi:hypothetical protein